MKENLCLNGNQYTEAPKSSHTWIQTDSRQQRETIERMLDTHVEFVDLFIQSLSDNGRDLYGRLPAPAGHRRAWWSLAGPREALNSQGRPWAEGLV